MQNMSKICEIIVRQRLMWFSNVEKILPKFDEMFNEIKKKP